jgi:hypothetical protein
MYKFRVTCTVEEDHLIDQDFSECKTAEEFIMYYIHNYIPKDDKREYIFNIFRVDEDGSMCFLDCVCINGKYEPVEKYARTDDPYARGLYECE